MLREFGVWATIPLIFIFKMEKEIQPIWTEEGRKQRDAIRERLVKKADAERRNEDES